MLLMSVLYIILANMNQFSQGRVATDLKWGGRFYYSFYCSSSENSAAKELLKYVNIWRSYCQNEKGDFSMTHSVRIFTPRALRS